MTDFTYSTDDGFWFKLTPESPQAVDLYNQEIAPKTDGTGKVFAPHFPQVRKQLRAAGYTVRKARTRRGADHVTQSDADLLRELGK